MMGTTQGHVRVSGCLERLNLAWTKLLNVTTNGSPNLTGKKTSGLCRIQDRVGENRPPNSDVIFIHYISHQESV